MDPKLAAAMALDTQFQENVIVQVVDEPDRWSVQVTDGGWVSIRKDGRCTIPPVVNERMRIYGTGVGYPIRGITIGGRVYFYNPSPVRVSPPSASEELAALRRTCRSLERAARHCEVSQEVTVDSIRQVMANRGWTMIRTRPWPEDSSRVAFEIYDNPRAQGMNRGILYEVAVPVEKLADWAWRVRDWAEATAYRHGVSAAEILSEALLLAQVK